MAASALGCSSSGPETLLTYFNGEHSVSVRYPASWHTEQAEQDGMWYRYFLAPSSGPAAKPAVSVTLFVGSLAGIELDAYAASYLDGKQIASRHDVERNGARGHSYLFATPDGDSRFLLLLLERAGSVVGLYAQGDAAPFEMDFPILEEMADSLTLERLEDYPVERNEDYAYALSIPRSWRSTRGLASGGHLLRQFSSPPIARDPGSGSVHASLSLSVEPAQTLEAFYNEKQLQLGDAFRLLGHEAWRDGYADLGHVETPIAAARARRYYRVAGGFGYLLACEARDDAFGRVSAWCDLIASGLRVGDELRTEEVQ